jgi:tetratricopeptide (TPR) repeat protein
MRHRTGTCLMLLLFSGLSTGPVVHKPQSVQIEQEEYLEADDWFQAGVELNGEERYREAAEAFARSIAIAPSNALSWLNLGTAQALTGDYESAIVSLKKSILLDQSLALAYSNLAEVCFKSDRYKEAVEAYTTLLKLWPANANALYKLGLSHLLLNESDKAQGEYLSLKIVDPELAEKLRRAIIQGASY